MALSTLLINWQPQHGLSILHVQISRSWIISLPTTRNKLIITIDMLVYITPTLNEVVWPNAEQW